MKYSFELKLKAVPNVASNYAIDLSSFQESYPESYFTEEVCQEIRSSLQKQTNCLINEFQLKQMITTWIDDIKEGYRQTMMTLDLPNIFEAKCALLQESGNQQLPELFPPDLSGIEPQFGCLPPLDFV